MPISDYELDALLARCAEPVPGLDPAAARAAVQRAARPARHRRRTRRGWTFAAVFATAGALALPTAAVAEQYFQAQTGIIDDGYGTETQAGDEWIATEAADFGAYVSSVAPRELPTPAGFDWEAEAATVASWYSDEPGTVQRIGLVSDLERALWLGWLLEWIEADSAGDNSRREQAIAVLREAPTWPATVATDGGGIRYLKWAYVARMTYTNPEARTAAGQALLQMDVVNMISAQHHALTGRGMGGETPAEVEEILDLHGPSSRALYAVWDGVNRLYLLDEIFQEFMSMSDETNANLGSRYWDDYDLALIEVATAAGVADPEAAVGRGGWGH